jgi:hypothetical protein
LKKWVCIVLARRRQFTACGLTGTYKRQGRVGRYRLRPTREEVQSRIVVSRMSRQTIPQRILVAGIPGSGKTSYCSWLEREKGLLHLDIDELSKESGIDLKLELLECLRHSAGRFLKVIAAIEQPIALDWGFPTALLGLVHCLNLNGFAIWWFDGDREAARESFLRRGTVAVAAFDAQMKAIEEHWQQIQDVFDENLIHTVSAGPAYLTPEHIYKRMFR